MNRSEYLYDTFLSMLFEIDSRHHSCLNDLVLLKDYKKIMTSKLKDEDDVCNDINPKYRSLYDHQVNAEKMKRYIEENILMYNAINAWDLFIQLKNGERFIYDSFDNIVRFNKYKTEELTEEEELEEFSKNLKKILTRNFITQTELARRMGVSRMTISRYTNGIQIPDFMTLRKMSKILNCSIDDFFYKKY